MQEVREIMVNGVRGSATVVLRTVAGTGEDGAPRRAARRSRLATARSRIKLSRSTAARSSTMRAGWPSAASSTNAFSTRTGPLVSMTMREPPCITRP